MERLTEKSKLTKGYKPKYDNGVYVQYINKLGELEDIEEKLGIDLTTLFKALKNGIYYQTNGYLVKIRLIKLAYINGWCLTDGNFYPNTKDYKTKWWLKEDKSE